MALFTLAEEVETQLLKLKTSTLAKILTLVTRLQQLLAKFSKGPVNKLNVLLYLPKLK